MKAGDIRSELAHSLEIQPEQILEYRAYAEGYTVLTSDFRKYTAVQPAAAPPPSGYPAGMPGELEVVFDDPDKARVQELRKLASFLGIPGASALRKIKLQEAIRAWKKTNL